MSDKPTCGKGLAANAPVPAKMAALLESVAENLELHMGALDTSDEASRNEYAVYDGLAVEHRENAARLRATAERMAGYRDLPMGRHDMHLMGSPAIRAAFERYVAREEDLIGLLRQKIDQDRAMLASMHAAG